MKKIEKSSNDWSNNHQFNKVSNTRKLQKKSTAIKKTVDEVPRHLATIEAEKGETIVGNFTGTGMPSFLEIKGKPHSKGGTFIAAPDESYVFSKFNKMTIKDPNILSSFGFKKPATPAVISRKYNFSDDMKGLMNPDSDERQQKTYEKNIQNSINNLGKLALVQEAMKGFPTGIPKISMPYMETSKTNPEAFIGNSQEEGDADSEASTLQNDEQQQQPALQQGGDPLQQLLQQVTEALQQGAKPEEIVVQLLQQQIQPQLIAQVFVQLGMPEQQVQQMMSAIIQQLQNQGNQQQPDMNEQQMQGQPMPQQQMESGQEGQNPEMAMQRYGGQRRLKRAQQGMPPQEMGEEQMPSEEQMPQQQGNPQQQGDPMMQVLKEVTTALQQGAKPEEIIVQLLQHQIPPELIMQIFMKLGMPQDQAQQMIGAVMQQGQGEQQQMAEAPMARYGGQRDLRLPMAQKGLTPAQLKIYNIKKLQEKADAKTEEQRQAEPYIISNQKKYEKGLLTKNKTKNQMDAENAWAGSLVKNARLLEEKKQELADENLFYINGNPNLITQKYQGFFGDEWVKFKTPITVTNEYGNPDVMTEMRKTDYDKLVKDKSLKMGHKDNAFSPRGYTDINNLDWWNQHRLYTNIGRGVKYNALNYSTTPGSAKPKVKKEMEPGYTFFHGNKKYKVVASDVYSPYGYGSDANPDDTNREAVSVQQIEDPDQNFQSFFDTKFGKKLIPLEDYNKLIKEQTTTEVPKKDEVDAKTRTADSIYKAINTKKAKEDAKKIEATRIADSLKNVPVVPVIPHKVLVKKPRKVIKTQSKTTGADDNFQIYKVGGSVKKVMILRHPNANQYKQGGSYNFLQKYQTKGNVDYTKDGIYEIDNEPHKFVGGKDMGYADLGDKAYAQFRKKYPENTQTFLGKKPENYTRALKIARLNDLVGRHMKEENLTPLTSKNSDKEMNDRAGELQRFMIKNYPQLVTHYMTNRNPTPNQRLINLVKTKKDLPKYHINPNKITTRDVKRLYDAKVLTTEEINNAYNDNLWDYRALDTQSIQIPKGELDAKRQAGLLFNADNNDYESTIGTGPSEELYTTYYSPEEGVETPADEKTKKPNTTPALVENETYPDIPPRRWLQDNNQTRADLRERANMHKYYPQIYNSDLYLPDVVYADPTREMTGIGEMANTGARQAASLGPGFSARYAALQSGAAKNIADVMGRYNNMNVGIANNFENTKANMLNRYSQERANNFTNLNRANTVLNQQWDNAKQAWDTKATLDENSAITNMAQTDVMNSQFPQYAVDPSTGGTRPYFLRGKSMKAGTGTNNSQQVYKDILAIKESDKTLDMKDAIEIYKLGNPSYGMNNQYPKSNKYTPGSYGKYYTPDDAEEEG
jgi:hypothetical protein